MDTKGGAFDLSRLTFEFAKTMPETPHWYVIRTAENKADFLDLFHAVKENGVDERWGRATYRYWYPGDGFKYWASPPYLPACKCINRAKVEGWRAKPNFPVEKLNSECTRRWPAGSTPGLARLRANTHAERIRQAVLADQEAALADAGAAIAADNAAAMTAALSASRDSLIADEPLVEQRDLIGFVGRDGEDQAKSSTDLTTLFPRPVLSAAKPEPAPAKPALSEGATRVLSALSAVMGAVGVWVDQKSIPHGMTGKAVPGYLSGLQKRGLVELRADSTTKFSARMTMAGFALVQEERP